MTSIGNFEKTVTERSKLNCDNTLPSIYDKNIERVETLSFLDPFISKFNESLVFNDFLPKSNKKIEFINQKSLNIPLLKKNCVQLIQRNNQNQQIGSVNKEVSLEKKRANIEDKINLLNYHKRKLLEKREIIKKEIEEIKLDIHFQENLDSYVNWNEIYNKKKEEYLSESIRNKKQLKKLQSHRRSSIDLVKFNLSMQKAASDRKQDFEFKKKNKEDKEKERQEINDNINEMNEELSRYRNDLNIIKNKLLMHYHNILSEGSDARQDGLCWIIIAVWNLGYNIITSFFPKFLDDKCIEFLFSSAIMEIEHRNIRKEIDELKNKFKTKGKIDKKTFRTGLRNKKLDDENRLGISTTSSTKHLNYLYEKYTNELPMSFKKLSINSIKDIINYNEPDENTKNYIHNLKELEKLLEKKKSEKEILKNNEMKRINREFLMNDYERRFKVKQLRLLIALVGIENAHIEVNRQIKEQKEFYQKISVCKTFNFLNPDNLITRSLKNKGLEIRSPQVPRSELITSLELELAKTEPF